jgi:hypothetical protein
MQEQSLSTVSMSLSLSLTFFVQKTLPVYTSLKCTYPVRTLTCGKAAYLDLLHETNTLAYYAMAK